MCSRPLIEHCSSNFSPFTATNINKITAVQQNFTKNISELTSCSYKDNLLNLNLESLKIRRLKFDVAI
jgi:hypothetical protein